MGPKQELFSFPNSRGGISYSKKMQLPQEKSSYLARMFFNVGELIQKSLKETSRKT